MRASYRSAWSIWPGVIHLKDFELRGEDDNVQWDLQVDEISFRCSLHELFARTFHAQHVRARGLGWALRFKRPLAETTPQTLYGLPAVLGFDPMPLKPLGPDELDSDAKYHLWTIHLDDVDADGVREVWVQTLHLYGLGHITGGFFLKPMRHVEVMAQLEAQGMVLAIGDHPLATQLRGHLAATLHPLDLRAPPPAGPLSLVDVGAQLRGQLGDLGFIQRNLPDGTELSEEPGPLALDVRVEGGVLQAASTAAASTAHLHFATPTVRLDSAASAALAVGEVGAPGSAGAAPLEAVATGELSSLTLSLRRSNAAPLQARSLRAAISSAQRDLSRGLAWSGLSLDLDAVRAPDLRLLQDLLPGDAKVRIEGGAAEAHGHFEVSRSSAHGTLAFSAHDARVSSGGTHLRWDALGEARLRGRDATSGALDLSTSHVEIEKAQAAGGQGPAWWGRFELPRASVDPAAKSAALELSGQCLDARPLRALFDAEGVPGFVASFFVMPHFEVKGGLRVSPGQLELTDLDARGQGAEIRANYQSRQGAVLGEALITLGVATAALDLDGGRAHVILAGARSFFEKRQKADRAKDGTRAVQRRAKRGGDARAARAGAASN